MKTHQKVAQSLLLSLLIILFLSGNATADTYSFSLSSAFGDRDTFNFTVNSVGTIYAIATWTETAANLALILNGPGQVGYYARNDGPSPLSLKYTVTSADLTKGSGWTLSIVNFRGGDATGTAIITYPTGPTPPSGVTTPSAPQNLKATTGDGYVTLGWSAPSDDGGSTITVYLIYRGTSYGKEVLLDSVTASRTLYKDTAVKNGQTYYYKVSAVNKEEEEGTFASTKATPTSSVTKPSSPQKLQSEASDRSVYLEWIAPDDDGGSKITKYNIYRGTTSGGETLLTTVGNVLTYTDNDVTNDRTYYYQVSAVNSVGEGEKSDEASATPSSGITTPSRPRALKATASDRVVNLNWHAPVDDGGSTITEYQIYRGTSSDAGSYLYSVSAPTTSYTDRTVTNDLIYYYKVSAENSVGEGEKSNEVDVWPKSSLTEPTVPIVTTPSAPLNFRASIADGNVNLGWREPSDEGGSPITNYKIYRGTTSGGETLLKTVSNVLSYTDDDVANNQKYYYQVSAENSAGEGNMSDEASATLIPGVSVPSAPQHLNADQGDEYVDLSWNPPSNEGGSPITEYRVYRGTAPQGESFLAEVGNVLIYTDAHVTNDQQYYYQVSAVNSAGEGEKSNEVGVEPKGDTLGMGVWITIIVALIGALGVIAAALINYFSSKKTK